MFDFFSKWKEKIGKLIETRVQLVQLELIEKVSKLMGLFVFILLLIIIAFGVFLFLGFGISEVLSYCLDSRIWGNFATALLYIGLGAIVFALRKRILKWIASTFVSALTEQKDEENENSVDRS